jgi:hypothetical protein
MKEVSMKMKKMTIVLLTVLVSCVLAGMLYAQQGVSGSTAKKGVALYDPKEIYPGDYKADMLLFKNGPKDLYWRSIPNLERLRRASCFAALDALNREGRWQGHLNLDGSCGNTSEPADWAVGNRLNYEELIEQGGNQ